EAALDPEFTAEHLRRHRGRVCGAGSVADDSVFLRIIQLVVDAHVQRDSSPLAGALMTTFFAPPVRWPRAFSAAVKRPVDSTTRSAPAVFHGMAAGSRSENTLIAQSLTRSSASRASTRPGKAP